MHRSLIVAAMCFISPRIYQVGWHPEYTEAQMLREFGWAYAAGIAALIVFVAAAVRRTS